MVLLIKTQFIYRNWMDWSKSWQGSLLLCRRHWILNISFLKQARDILNCSLHYVVMISLWWSHFSSQGLCKYKNERFFSVSAILIHKYVKSHEVNKVIHLAMIILILKEVLCFCMKGQTYLVLHRGDEAQLSPVQTLWDREVPQLREVLGSFSRNILHPQTIQLSIYFFWCLQTYI